MTCHPRQYKWSSYRVNAKGRPDALGNARFQEQIEAALGRRAQRGKVGRLPKQKQAR